MSQSQVNLSSCGGHWRRLFDASLTSASFGSLKGRKFSDADVRANPFVPAANLAIIDYGKSLTARRPVPNSTMFRFWGAANDGTFDVQIWGIEESVLTATATDSRGMEATLLARLAVTVGNLAGLDGTMVPTAGLEADTIALTYGVSTFCPINSPGSDIRQAWAQLDHLGFPVLAVEFALGTATAANGGFRPLW